MMNSLFCFFQQTTIYDNSQSKDTTMTDPKKTDQDEGGTIDMYHVKKKWEVPAIAVFIVGLLIFLLAIWWSGGHRPV
jgi:hypothetical protein